ncbi:hypothetical protein [Mycolicibacterium palauense]|uniref:hypothetical protein n=1 Tax=Mycolicibacterium palauense TaxID=2034511 RepID=UPI001FE9F740|nr:hypothetical protein [Mycolicibacterium palauense]
MTVARATLSLLAVAMLGYLGVLAAWPGVSEQVPPGLRWFGAPNSAVTIAIVTAVLVALAIAMSTTGVRSGGGRPGAPVAIVVGLAMISAALGGASYWRCHDGSNPTFFTPLIWTAGLVKGGSPDHSLDTGACPSPTPVALDIAQLSALAALFLSVVGVAVALFQSRLDRLRAYLAHTVTVVVDLDADAASLMPAIARTLERGRLVVVTSDTDQPCVREARTQGARVLLADFSRPESYSSLPLWHKLDRLYLLSADPSTNLARLAVITTAVTGNSERHRVPLIVRIDDPWQASAWRAQHFGGTATLWAADTVGRYEVTARRLLDALTAAPPVDEIFVCGASPLTLALCADLAQRRLEREYQRGQQADPTADSATVTLVGPHADEYEKDHRYSRSQLGMPDGRPEIRTVTDTPTVALLASLLDTAAHAAVVLVDGGDATDTTAGTRLAARFPDTPIYAWDPAAAEDIGVPLVGQLRTFRLSMATPEGQAHDAWERAARLIHERYRRTAAASGAATVAWEELGAFYRNSNRRQVRNALWMVEAIGGHTWNTWGGRPDTLTAADLAGLDPIEQMRRMGFDRETALAMARAEHADWCRFYRAAGWRHGVTRDDARKVHDKLVDFSAVAANPELLDTALRSLAATLISLRELGYRSRPIDEDARWRTFRRVGTVTAERRDAPWTWTTRSGEVLRAAVGDWAVRDGHDEHSWSVRDDIFRATYEHVDGDRWRRRGTVQARPARVGEVIETLEGPVTAAAGDMVVRGEHDDQWPVPADEFARRYASVSTGTASNTGGK